MLNLRKHIKGITIVEVMLSITILGLVLGLSYASAGRNLRASRDAQERAEAFQYAQSVVEAIKAYTTKYEYDSSHPTAKKIYPNDTDDTMVFCVDTKTTSINNPLISPKNPGDPICDYELYTHSVTATRVEFVNAGGSIPAGVRSYQYEVTVQWESIVNSNLNEVVMRYRAAKVEDY